MNIEFTQTSVFECPNCGRMLDCVSKSASHKDITKLYSVCIYCTATFIPDGQGGYRGLTIQEWINLKRDNRNTYDTIQNAVRYFSKLRHYASSETDI